MNVAVIGKGGHSKVVQDIIRTYPDYRICAYLDDRYQEFKCGDDGVFVGPISDARQLAELVEDLDFIIAIGHNEARSRVAETLKSMNCKFATFIHPTAVISPQATVGCGTVIMPNAVVNADVNIGEFCIVNTAAVVEHDSIVHDFAHIAPHATLTGAVVAEEGAFVGAGAVVIPGKRLGAWSTTGAGATVITDIPSYRSAVGSPARLLQITRHGDEELEPHE